MKCMKKPCKVQPWDLLKPPWTLLESSKIEPEFLLGSIWQPGGTQERPRDAQEAPKRRPGAPKSAQEPPKSTQEGVRGGGGSPPRVIFSLRTPFLKNSESRLSGVDDWHHLVPFFSITLICYVPFIGSVPFRLGTLNLNIVVND